MLPMLRRNVFWPTIGDDPFASLKREMESLFDRFVGGDGGFATQPWATVPFTIWEDEDHFFVEADLPGVAESDVEVTVHNGMLYVRGERRVPEGRTFLYNGRNFGRFERVISLPEAVATDAVKATLSNGILTVELTKSPEAKPHKIAIQKG